MEKHGSRIDADNYLSVVMSDSDGKEIGWIAPEGTMVSWSLRAKYETQEQADQAATNAAKQHNLFADVIVDAPKR